MSEYHVVLKWWETAYYIRKVENIISEVYSEGRMRCPTHLSIGQEMTPSILCHFLETTDKVVSSHRSHAHYLAKGGCLEELFDELHGLPTGCSKGHGGSMHLKDDSVGFICSTAIVGNTIPIGVGIAESIALDKKKNVVGIFLGDGATEEGVFWESLQYALTRSLPCLFVIENNSFSVYTDLNRRQGTTQLSKKLLGFTENVYECKNHDYELFARQCIESIAIARNGRPVVLLVDTFRYREHCGPAFDDNLGYRTEEHIEHWKRHDIINLLRADLLQSYSDQDLRELAVRIDRKCHAAYSKSERKRAEFMELKWS